ncbi:MAG: glycosyltransferase family A protein [Caulobacterales bacterium]
MKLAVVIPAYNFSHYIGATLRTVTTQTLADFEVIVVDDGSKDDTANVAREALADFNGPWTIVSQSNAGLPAARNAGWKATQAEWIQFLDADDFLAPQKLELQLNVAADLAPDVACVSSPWREVAIDGDVVRTVRDIDCSTFPDQPTELEVLAKGPLLTLGQSLFRRDWVVEVGGFDPALRVDEDQDFYLRLARKGARQVIVPSDAPLFFWRQQLKRRLGGAGARWPAVDLTEQFVGHLLRITNGDLSALDQLSSVDRATLIRRCSSYMRLLYRYDRPRFRQRLSQLDAMFGQFIPTDPSYLTALSRVVGFERAETVASIYRTAKRLTGEPSY